MEFQLPRWIRPGLMLVLFACLLTFTGINRFDLRESTEPREAGMAADMLQNNQFVMPTLNGRPFLEKPPLSYWLQAASIEVFGYEAFAPRLPSALAAIATILLLVFFFRRTEESAWLTLLAGFFLISMASFWSYARTAGQDMLLAFGVTLALLAFYFTRENSNKGLWWLYGMGIAIATLTKGVIGLAVPGIVIFAFLVLETFYLDKRMVFSRWLFPALFAVLGLIPLMVWLWILYDAQGLNAVKEVMWTNSVGRFQGEYEHGAHAEPIYFYLLKLPETYQPWSLLLYLAAAFAIKSFKQHRRVLFFLCWFIAPYILLSMSAGKRPSYLLMLYPAAAALLAQLIVLLSQKPEIAGKRANLVKWLLGVEAVIFTSLVIMVSLKLAKVHLPVLALVCVVVTVPLLWLLWRAVLSLRMFNFFASSAGIILITYLAYFSFIVPYEDQKQSAKRVMQQLAQFADAGRPVGLYRPTERMEGATSFYLQRRLPVYRSEAELTAALAQQPSLVVLAAEADQFDLTAYKDEAQLKYSSTQYHYISAK